MREWLAEAGPAIRKKDADSDKEDWRRRRKRRRKAKESPEAESPQERLEAIGRQLEAAEEEERRGEENLQQPEDEGKVKQHEGRSIGGSDSSRCSSK